MKSSRRLLPYRSSLAGNLLAAREAVMAPIRPALRQSGVTEQQWRVLRVIVDQGSIDASRLAQAALLHPPSVTRILKELIDRQLIVRTADPKDGRRSVVEASPAGHVLIERTASHTLSLLQIYADRFGEARLAHLREELAALTKAISDLAPQSPEEGT